MVEVFIHFSHLGYVFESLKKGALGWVFPVTLQCLLRSLKAS